MVDLPALGRPTMATRIGREPDSCHRRGTPRHCRRHHPHHRAKRVIEFAQALAVSAKQDRITKTERISFHRAAIAGLPSLLLASSSTGLPARRRDLRTSGRSASSQPAHR